MGCDIHLYTEQYRNIQDKPQWINIDHWKYNPYSKDYEDESEYDHVSLYRDRNYTLFSILAGVRDYSDKSLKIAEPRGLPHDISDITKREADYWEGDGHSHSYFTLKELKDFVANNEMVVTRTGMISPEQQKELKEGIKPTWWCQGTNQEGYVRHTWQDEDNSLPELIALIEQRAKDEYINDDRNIRIVFWFDN